MAPFTPIHRGGPGGARPGVARPVGQGKGGKGKSVNNPFNRGAKRHRKIAKDCILGITKPDIRRMARRGGVKRISAQIYDDVRSAMKDRLTMIIRDCVTYLDYRKAKTITVNDVIHSLRRHGRPIYGFDPESYDHAATVKKARKRRQQQAAGAEDGDSD